MAFSWGAVPIPGPGKAKGAYCTTASLAILGRNGGREMPPRALTALLPSPLMSNVSIGCRIGGQAGAGNVVHNFQPWERK